MRCIVHKTRPCVQDDRVGSHFDLSRIIDKQVSGAIRLRNTRPRKSCAIWQGPLQQFPHPAGKGVGRRPTVGVSQE